MGRASQSSQLGAVTTLGRSESQIGGVAASPDGVLYVAEEYKDRILEIDVATGERTVFAGSGSRAFADGVGARASFHLPNGVDVSIPSTGGGKVFVADYGNSRIRMIDVETRAVTTLAGSGSRTFADGTGTHASFHSPRGVAVRGGKLFVADRATHSAQIPVHSVRGAPLTPLHCDLSATGGGYVQPPHPSDRHRGGYRLDARRIGAGQVRTRRRHERQVQPADWRGRRPRQLDALRLG